MNAVTVGCWREVFGGKGSNIEIQMRPWYADVAVYGGLAFYAGPAFYTGLALDVGLPVYASLPPAPNFAFRSCLMLSFC